MGKKRQPVYKVVAADVRSPRDGKIIEAIGLYNPKTNPATISIQENRALYWLGVGAQPTDTVRNILSKKGVFLRIDLLKRGLSEEEIAAKMDEWNKKNEAKHAAITKKAEVKKVKKEEKVESKEEANIEIESASEVKGAASDEAPEQKDSE